MKRFLSDKEQQTLDVVVRLADLNPFALDTRDQLVQEALGNADLISELTRKAVEPRAPVDPSNAAKASPAAGEPADTEPRERIRALSERLADTLRSRLTGGARGTARELSAYHALVRYVLYERYQPVFRALIERGERGEPTTIRIPEYRQYRRDVAHFLELPETVLPGAVPANQLFAWGFQIRRAYFHTFRQIYGASKPAARLRATVWQSIFTHDTDRYRRALYSRMADITTLILGESGTGKELVARAIGRSRYVPFDEERLAFSHDAAAEFYAVNLSALSSNLIESELFGHRRGAFTGAHADHAGWLEVCANVGTVFLDEIGELDEPLQVKLLRVLQERRFYRVGDTQERAFTGKVVAATNRNLPEEIVRGRFRADFYYRLCADVIRAPSLREQLSDTPEDLELLVQVLCRRIVGEAEAEDLTQEVREWIESHLGPNYTWPGNVRELEQCVRNILVRGEYRPEPSRIRPGRELVSLLEEGALNADAILRHYCTLVYAKTGSYEESARRLGLDRRTVKARIDTEQLERLKLDLPIPHTKV